MAIKGKTIPLRPAYCKQRESERASERVRDAVWRCRRWRKEEKGQRNVTAGRASGPQRPQCSMSYFTSHYTVITFGSQCRCDCGQWKKTLRIILGAFYILTVLICAASCCGRTTVFKEEFTREKDETKKKQKTESVIIQKVLKEDFQELDDSWAESPQQQSCQSVR